MRFLRSLRQGKALPPITVYGVTGERFDLPQMRPNFRGCVDWGMGSFTPDFRSLRRNGSHNVFALLLDEITPEQVMRGEMPAAPEVEHQDISYIMMERFMESSLAGVEPPAL